ncbi:MAG: hypothetical protein V4643_01080 [Bacteroidota bacterium]
MKEKEAILLIEEMISKTKEDIRDNGFLYYFWGWLVFIAALLNYTILHFDLFEFHGLPWMVLMPLGGIVTAIISRKNAKLRVKVKTYVSQSMSVSVTAYAISLFIVCFAMPAGEQWKAFYPTIMLIYAIWLYISGGLLKFKPLMWGAALNWSLALTGYLWASTEVHLLLMALGVLGGFIIPGYLLKMKANNSVQTA